MKKINVFLVDDHKLLLRGMHVMLEKQDDIQVIGEACNGIDFLDTLPNKNLDVVLMDIDMPGMSGIEAARKAFQIQPELKIITVSMFDDFDAYNEVIEAGVQGFVLKQADSGELIKAIHSVLDNEKYFSPQLLQTVVDYMAEHRDKSKLKHLLSNRELEVLELICKGLSSKDIAIKLGISDRTVERHRESLIRKTKTKNSVSLAVFAVKHKIIDG